MRTHRGRKVYTWLAGVVAAAALAGAGCSQDAPAVKADTNIVSASTSSTSKAN